MNYTYQCIEQKLYNENIGEYITYGIEITDENIIVNDVSCNKEKAIDITRLLNKHQASFIHLDEIIENLIAA